MTDPSDTATTGRTTGPVVFLHIPKTAGQTIHSELSRVVGDSAVSPVRVHTGAPPGVGQFPPGYRLYSGHIDWEALETLPSDRFVFSVLRAPLERIASFYFYTLRQAAGLSGEELATPERTGMRMITSLSADDYFFGGDQRWQRFIHDHYDNVYCTYFATRKIRGRRDIESATRDDLFRRALKGTKALDRIYSVDDLAALERDIEIRLGAGIKVADRFMNAGPEAAAATPALRWPQLAARFEKDASIRQLKSFGRLDRRLMRRLGLAED